MENTTTPSQSPENTTTSYASVISQSRSFIMGLAIIWIAIYHVPNHTTLPVLSFLQNIGYGGCDLFILLSGFGVYYSLSKNPDAYEFIKRRAMRILPAYFPFIIVWMIIHKILFRLYFTEICGNLTILGWWNGDQNQFNWYIDTIIVFYVIAPYLFRILTSSNKRMRNLLLLLVFAMLVGVTFMHGQLIIGVSRLPIFLIGMGLAAINNKFTEGRSSVIIWNISLVIGLAVIYLFITNPPVDLWHYGMYWYPFILIAPGLALDLGLLSNTLKKSPLGNKLNSLLSLIGDSSFEIFLIHLLIIENLMFFIDINWLGWTGLLILSFILGILYHKLVIVFQKMLQR